MIHKIVWLLHPLYRRARTTPVGRLMLRAYRKLRGMSVGRKVTAVRDGIRFELDLSEAIDSTIYHAGYFEKRTSEVLDQLCRPGMTVLDIGANVGVHTLRMARLVGSGGRVISFEPTHWAFGKIQRNCSLNAFAGNVTLERLALSDVSVQEVEADFASSWPLQSSESVLLHPVHRGAIRTESVQVMTLDDYAAAHDLQRIDLIKLDVDGAEAHVLRGAARTLGVHKPILLLELGHYSLAEQGDSLNGLLQSLADLGYAVCLEEDLDAPLTSREILSRVPVDGTLNAVCFPRELTTTH